MTKNKKFNAKNASLTVLLTLAIATFVFWQFPYGRIFLYPFVILGTWFHEMGHGLTAVVLGGSFIRLDIYPDGSGMAVHTANSFLGSIGRALIAADGPIGPTIAGSVFVLSSSKTKFSRFLMFMLGGMLIISDIIWVRTFFGFTMILVFGMIILLIAIKGKDKLQKICMQFLGIQAFLSLYLSIGYLFSRGGTVAGSAFSSDTQVISDSLFFPHWFWAGTILLFSLLMIIFSMVAAYRAGGRE